MGQAITFTDRAANGLYYVLNLLSNTLEESAHGLRNAEHALGATDAAAVARIDAEAEYRRGRTEGWALGASGASPILGQGERALCEKWARIGCFIAKQTFSDGPDNVERRRMEDNVQGFLDGWFQGREQLNHPDGEDAEGTSDSLMPRLTEEDTQEIQADMDEMAKHANAPNRAAG